QPPLQSNDFLKNPIPRCAFPEPRAMYEVRRLLRNLGLAAVVPAPHVILGGADNGRDPLRSTRNGGPFRPEPGRRRGLLSNIRSRGRPGGCPRKRVRCGYL